MLELYKKVEQFVVQSFEKKVDIEHSKRAVYYCPESSVCVRSFIGRFFDGWVSPFVDGLVTAHKILDRADCEQNGIISRCF